MYTGWLEFTSLPIPIRVKLSPPYSSSSRLFVHPHVHILTFGSAVKLKLPVTITLIRGSLKSQCKHSSVFLGQKVDLMFLPDRTGDFRSSPHTHSLLYVSNDYLATQTALEGLILLNGIIIVSHQANIQAKHSSLFAASMVHHIWPSQCKSGDTLFFLN